MTSAQDVDHRRAVSAADPDAVAETFRAGGAAHVRGAVDEALLPDVEAAAEAAFRSSSALAAENRLPAELAAAFERRFVPLGRLPLAPERLAALLHPAVRRLAREYLGKEPDVDPNSHVRSIALDRADTHMPFHQDQTILGRRLLNVWIPLSACGTGAPGLEVVWGSWSELLEPSPLVGAKFPVERARLDPAAVGARFGGDALWCPEFRAGDAMLFSGATIHRTHVNAGMTAGRMSVEFRLL